MSLLSTRQQFPCRRSVLHPKVVVGVRVDTPDPRSEKDRIRSQRCDLLLILEVETGTHSRIH